MRREIGNGELVRRKWPRRRGVRLRLRRVVAGEATGTADAEALKSGREVPMGRYLFGNYFL